MNVLSIDIGGTGLKAAVVDESGNMLTQRVRVGTPHPAPPDVVVEALVNLVAPLTAYEGVSVGFPGVVRQGRVLTAPNLGNNEWKDFDLASVLAGRLGKPVHVLNDADMQGLAAIEGKGVEMVITLGTGFGSAIFMDGQLGVHLELSQHIFRKGETYNEQLGNATLKEIGKRRWNRRVRRAIDAMRVLTNFDTLYVGGGNAAKIEFKLESNIKIIANEDGLKGGAWLWRPGKSKSSGDDTATG
ncbi:MAG: ROK family protein [Pyrinomonadaceae bacterium]